jgi:hypothetical protein
LTQPFGENFQSTFAPAQADPDNAKKAHMKNQFGAMNTKLISFFAVALLASASVVMVAANWKSVQGVVTPTRSQAVQTTSSQVATAPDTKAKSEGEVDWARTIDNLAGHPNDSTLPKGMLGASDQVLASIDPTVIAEIIGDNDALQFARSSESPRFLFALGRAAISAGYDTLGEKLLLEAVAKGSVPAEAYFALQLLDRNDSDQAKALLGKAQAGGFKAQFVEQALAHIKQLELDAAEAKQQGGNEQRTASPGDYDTNKFEGREFIAAFESGKIDKLPDLETLTYLQGLHGTLWGGGDILFMTSPRIMLELDANVASRITYRISSSRTAVAKSANAGISAGANALMRFMEAMQRAGNAQTFDEIVEVVAEGSADANRDGQVFAQKLLSLRNKGEQDGRRLAIGFEGNEARFRQIYSGIRAFVLR